MNKDNVTEENWKGQFRARFDAKYYYTDNEGLYTDIREFVIPLIETLLLLQRKSLLEQVMEKIQCEKHPDQTCGGCERCDLYQKVWLISPSSHSDE